MAMGSAFRSQGDRLLALAFVLMVTLALAGIVSGDTGATFATTSTNPGNHVSTLLVQPPASQSAPASSAGGVVNLSWTATPTAPGTGHTLSYNVLRGPAGGPYAQIATTAGLAYSDTPPADGTYQYVIQAKVTGGGTFTSANSTAQNGISDRTAPTMSITCNGGSCAGWFNATVSVTVSGVDTGTGMGSVTRNVDAGGQVSTGGAGVTFNVSGESAGHTVAYFGTDAAGNASASANQTVKIDLTSPTAATGITGVAGQGNGEIDLSWAKGTDALSGVASQTIHRSAAGPGACPAVNAANYPTSYAVSAAATSYTVTGLVSNKKYCFYVTTTDNAGNTKSSAASGRITAN
ncbi:MAG TPA: hypothetical protein VFC31_02495 [Candidatus Limnocylindria bacterium]|nr:hypothetical protein [Candidatus Limnocylindria bacterium]